MSQYPKTQAAAARFAASFHRALGASSPRSEVLRVINTDGLLTSGTLLASGQRGPVSVTGCPRIGVVPGMAIYARRLTHQGPPVYLFETMAPRAARFGARSGAVISPDGVVTLPAGTGATDSNVLTVPASPPAFGWFWSAYFYLADLPKPGGFATLVDMPYYGALGSTGTTANGGVRIDVDSGGHAAAYFYNWALPTPPGGTGTIRSPMSGVLSPHQIWHMTVQLGIGTVVDGVLDPIYAIGGIPVGLTTPGQTLSSGRYGLFLLGNHDTTSLAPAGSWLSKFLVGCGWDGVQLVQPYATGVLPQSDAEIPGSAASIGNGLAIVARYLFSEGADLPTATLLNAASSLDTGGGPTLSAWLVGPGVY